jgi:hypothetical protein
MKKNILLLVFTTFFLSNLNSFTEQNAKKVEITNAALGTAMGFGLGMLWDYAFSFDGFKVTKKNLMYSSLLGIVLGYIAYEDFKSNRPSLKLKKAKDFLEKTDEQFCLKIEFDDNFGKEFVDKLEKHYKSEEYSIVSLYIDLDSILRVYKFIIDDLIRSKDDILKSGFEYEYKSLVDRFEALKLKIEFRQKEIVKNDLFLFQDRKFRGSGRKFSLGIGSFFILNWFSNSIFNFKKTKNKNIRLNRLYDNEVALLRRIENLETRLVEVEGDMDIAFA